MVAELDFNNIGHINSLRVVQSHMVAELRLKFSFIHFRLRVVQSHMVAELICSLMRFHFSLRVVQSHMVAEQ